MIVRARRWTVSQMCGVCRREYEIPADRRFHAQPIACPPVARVSSWCRCKAGESGAEAALTRRVRGDSGGSGGPQGAGGFQLIVDASNEDAVARAPVAETSPRQTVGGDAAATPGWFTAVCSVSYEEVRYLASPHAPILLMRRRTDAASARAAGRGRARPSLSGRDAPVHATPRPAGRAGGTTDWVCTSGNRAEEPMAVETSEALERLSGIADLFLTHNRPIVRPLDDSVCRIDDGSADPPSRTRLRSRAHPAPEHSPLRARGRSGT